MKAQGDDMSRPRLFPALPMRRAAAVWLCIALYSGTLLPAGSAAADDQVTVRGRVRTADGSPLPKNVPVHASS